MPLVLKDHPCATSMLKHNVPPGLEREVCKRFKAGTEPAQADKMEASVSMLPSLHTQTYSMIMTGEAVL